MQWVLSYSLDTQVSSTILDYGSLGTGNFLWHRRIYPKSDKHLWIVIWFMLNLTNFDRPNRNFITELTIWSNNLWLSYQKVVFIYPSLIIFVLEFHGYIFWVSYGPYPDFLYLFSTLFSGVVADAHLAIWNYGRFCLKILYWQLNQTILYNGLHFEVNIVLENTKNQPMIFLWTNNPFYLPMFFNNQISKKVPNYNFTKKWDGEMTWQNLISVQAAHHEAV